MQLHDELKRAATAATGAGPPAVLRTSAVVVGVDTSTATITLDDGSQFSGDLIIGADGVSVSNYSFPDCIRESVLFLTPPHRVVRDQKGGGRK